MTRPVMFLRTAQTEQRITDLEEKMDKVIKHLKLDEPSTSDEEWEKAAPPQSKIAQKVARAKR